MVVVGAEAVPGVGTVFMVTVDACVAGAFILAKLRDVSAYCMQEIWSTQQGTEYSVDEACAECVCTEGASEVNLPLEWQHFSYKAILISKFSFFFII
jgi:hypothetical protein